MIAGGSGRWWLAAGVALGLAPVLGCGGGDDDHDVAVCDPPPEQLAEGDPNGHPDPLGAGPGEARAGRVTEADLPPTSGEMAVWAGGDFVVANDRIAMVIEDVGASDLYDPWGGRPVGLARVEDGEMVEPADFGEFFVLTGRNSVVTRSVTVLDDGSDGQAAVVRAIGNLAPTPFFESLMGPVFREEYPDIETAIDYVLEPDAEYVDIYLTYRSPRTVTASVISVMHAYMYTARMWLYEPGRGFGAEGKSASYVALVDDDATSYAYQAGQCDRLGGGIAESGFASNFCDGWDIEPCTQTRVHHSRITIGGPGLDPLLEAVARVHGDSLREVSGTVLDGAGEPAAGVRVHAENQDGDYLTRATTDADGHYALHTDPDEDLYLTAWRLGDRLVGPLHVAADATTQDFQLDPTGFIHVIAEDADGGGRLPVRIQILPAGDSVLPDIPDNWGEFPVTNGRLRVDFEMTGEATLSAPVGDWEVVVSRGYEYELHRETVTVTEGATTEVSAALAHSIDTTGVMCADFHIHTNRSPDAIDDAPLKVRSAVADGLDIPVRSDHEFVNDFQPVVEQLGLEDWAFGMTSTELTTMELYGHFGVLPLVEDDSKPNGGTPQWQRFPSADDPDAELYTLTPPELFAEVRARPEQPTIIINHPRSGSNNYFNYVGYDRASGTAEFPDLWDEEFRVVEVFNGSSWTRNRDETVADWLSFLDHGRRVFAVGSSDSHSIKGSPVGYPRTCMPLGTDDPHQVTPELVRSEIVAGHAMVTGGIYLDAAVGDAGPGDEVTGAPAEVTLSLTIRAATWIDVDWIEVVVDGATFDTIAVLPEDADIDEPVIRYTTDLTIPVAATGSYVIVAAWGNSNLDPVHPGRQPFGVTNPIFLTP